MSRSDYFRAQALLCLEIASQMSDPVAAEDLRAAAAKHLARARELERTDKMDSRASEASK